MFEHVHHNGLMLYSKIITSVAKVKIGASMRESWSVLMASVCSSNIAWSTKANLLKLVDPRVAKKSYDVFDRAYSA